MGMAEYGETEDNKRSGADARKRALDLLRENADGGADDLGAHDGDGEGDGDGDIDGPEHEEREGREEREDGEQRRRAGKSTSTSQRNAATHDDSDDDTMEGNSEAHSSTVRKL